MTRKRITSSPFSPLIFATITLTAMAELWAALTREDFCWARRHKGIGASIRLLMSVCLAFYPMLTVVGVGAQEQSAITCKGQGAQSREARNKVNETFKVFEDLLAVSTSAAEPNSHWRVKLASWHDAQQAWEKISVTLPSSHQSLKRCAIPLDRARGLIEQAENLFVQAQDSSDPTTAVDLLVEHKRLQVQAKGLLKRAKHCYCAARNSYLKGK